MTDIDRLTAENARLREERDALAATCEQYYDYCQRLGITPVPAIGTPKYNLAARDERKRREALREAADRLVDVVDSAPNAMYRAGVWRCESVLRRMALEVE